MSKSEKGFSILESLLVLIIALLVGFIGYYVWHTNRTTPQKTISPSPAASQISSSSLEIKEWSIGLTLPAALKGISYKFMPASGDLPNDSIVLTSAQTKGLSTRCDGEDTTSGEIGSVTITTSDPRTTDPTLSSTANDVNIKHLDNKYYTLSFPNGNYCAAATDKRLLQSEEREQLRAAFKTLKPLNQ